jgi:Domain of unknown function (DUF397)
VNAAWRKFERDTELINRVRDYGLAHPDATAEDTLAALEEPATADNLIYAGTGLFLAAQTRELTARTGLTQAPLGEEHKPKENVMSGINPDSLTWFTSSFSAAGACVEVAVLPDQAGVAVRDSKDRSRRPHFFAPDEWRAFTNGHNQRLRTRVKAPHLAWSR